jgi:hypothetical protein
MGNERVRESRGRRNEAEKAFLKVCDELGWYATSKGYPDFICYTPNDIILVEVKPTKRCRLKSDQWRFMNAMAKKGVHCYRWSPDNDWTKKHVQKVYYDHD